MENALFKRLQALEELEYGPKNYPLSANINNYLVPVSSVLLASIPAYMPEYTLHNITHCEAILDNIAKILPAEVELNIVELTILIYAVTLHDIGMVVNKDAAESLKDGREFNDMLIEFEGGSTNDEILTELIRRKHVDRSLQYIEWFKRDFKIYKIDFTYKGIDFSEWVKNVVLSHAKPVAFLRDETLFPTAKLIGEHKVDVQFLAVLLRLGDILDFDIFRTPPFLYHHINPKNKISIGEWEKHLSIEGKNYNQREIAFDAKCSEAAIERLVRNFIQWIEQERLESMALLTEHGHTQKLKLDTPVRLNCRSDGSYIYTDLKLELDYEKVLHILMGTELYETPDVFIRELIQNAYDACKHRQQLAVLHMESYIPKISIVYNSSSNILEVRDNGIGIDDEIFQNYLTRIGKSYYKSKKFQSLKLNFKPISNFGIGILSSFMVSDTIEIESLRYVSPGEKSAPVNYVLDVHDKYLAKKNSHKSDFGTMVKLHLKEDYLLKLKDKSVKDIIESNMTCYQIPISLKIDDTESILDGTMIIVPEDYKTIQGIQIFEISGFEWLKGFVVIHDNQHSSILTPQKISQQCFTITGGRTGFSVSPRWLKHTRFYLDIQPPYTLSLKANRSAIHEDENYNFLRNTIVEFLIDKFNESDNLAVLGNHLSDGRGSVLSGNEKEYNFLRERVPFIFLNTKTGQTKQMNFNQFMKEFKGGPVGVLHFQLLGDQLKEMNDQLKQIEWVLISDYRVNIFYQFVAPLVKEYDLIVTETPGFIYYELQFEDVRELKISDYSTNYNWVREYSIIYKKSDSQLFCVVGNNQYNSIDIQINGKSKLGRLIKTYPNNIFVKRFLGSFKTNISHALLQKYQLVTYRNFDGEHHFISMDNHLPYSVPCIGLISTNFIETLNASLLKDMLQPLKKSGLLKDNKVTDYLLSNQNFPAWWIRK